MSDLFILLFGLVATAAAIGPLILAAYLDLQEEKKKGKL